MSDIGVDFQAVQAGKFRRYNRGVWKEAIDVRTQLSNAADASRSLRGYMAARRILRKFHPNVVLVKGGNVGWPIGLAASHLKIPLVLHESDVEMGKGNRLLIKQAQAVATAFPVTYYKNLPSGVDAKLHFVGNPVRPELVSKQTKTEHKSGERLVLLVIGGSQGAHVINEFVFDNLKSLTEGYSVVHITGKADVEHARIHKSRLPVENQPHYEIFDFVADPGLMCKIYGAADVALTRPGINTIVELAANKVVPIVIAPFSNRHQWVNAQALEKLAAARVFRQEEISILGIKAAIDRLYDRDTERQHLLTQLGKLYHPDSATKIEQLLLAAGQEGRYATGR